MNAESVPFWCNEIVADHLHRIVGVCADLLGQGALYSRVNISISPLAGIRQTKVWTRVAFMVNMNTSRYHHHYIRVHSTGSPDLFKQSRSGRAGPTRGYMHTPRSNV